jgi:hypothetical protein
MSKRERKQQKRYWWKAIPFWIIGAVAAATSIWFPFNCYQTLGRIPWEGVIVMGVAMLCLSVIAFLRGYMWFRGWQ